MSAGEGLCDFLCDRGKDEAALKLCEEVLLRLPMTAWANRRKGLLLASKGKNSDAIPFLHALIRQNPKDATVWEAVGACYERLQRFSAAQKSFRKALELDPCRPFSLVELGKLLLRDQRSLEALECYQKSLSITPECPVSLMGAAKCLKACGSESLSIGAVHAAANDLDRAIMYASRMTSKNSSFISAWKLLGDVLQMRAEVLSYSGNDLKGPSAGKASIKYRMEMTSHIRKARRAYGKALHLSPWVASAWQDVAGCLYNDSRIQGLHDAAESFNTGEGSASSSLVLRRKSEWIMRGGLRLDPQSAVMWSTLGIVSTEPARKEYALSRSLQLDPSNAVAWVALAKMYIGAREFELAAKCLQQGRTQVPTSGLVWETMAVLAAEQGDSTGAADFAEHAVGLGGGPHSLLMYALALIKQGKGDVGEAFVAIRRAAELLPFDPAALNALGLACEAKGDYQHALNAYNAALHSLLEKEDVSSEPSDTTNRSRMRDTLQCEDGIPVAGALHLNIARVLVALGHDAEALRSYQSCCELVSTAAVQCLHPLALVINAIAKLRVGGHQEVFDSLTTLLAGAQDFSLPDPVKAAAVGVLLMAYNVMDLGHLVLSQVLSPHLKFSSPQTSYVEELLAAAVVIASSSSNGEGNGKDDSQRMSHNEILRLVTKYLPYDADHVGAFLHLWAINSLEEDAQEAELSISGYCKAVHTNPCSLKLRTALGNASLRRSPHYAFNVLQLLHFPSKDLRLHGFPTKDMDSALRVAFLAVASIGPATTKSIRAHVERILGLIARTLRGHPWDHNAWYMGSILATQLASASGLLEPGAGPAWRRALSWCRGALGMLSRSEMNGPSLRRSRLCICMSECTLALISLSLLNAPLAAGYQEAMHFAEMALHQAPSLDVTSDALRQVARCYFYSGDLKNAEDMYKESLRMDRKRNAFGTLELGRLLEIKGNSTSAIELMKESASQLKQEMSTECLSGIVDRRLQEALHEMLSLNCCLALLRAGSYDEARTLLIDEQPRKDPVGIDPRFEIRTIILGAIALQQARKTLSMDEERGKMCLGEARQALGNALKLGQDGMLIRILLSVLEYAGMYRKKAERIASHAAKAIELSERPVPAYALLVLAEVSGETVYRAKARHLVPWLSGLW